jgi:hypothetical protein
MSTGEFRTFVLTYQANPHKFWSRLWSLCNFRTLSSHTLFIHSMEYFGIVLENTKHILQFIILDYHKILTLFVCLDPFNRRDKYKYLFLHFESLSVDFPIPICFVALSLFFQYS